MRRLCSLLALVSAMSIGISATAATATTLKKTTPPPPTVNTKATAPTKATDLVAKPGKAAPIQVEAPNTSPVKGQPGVACIASAGTDPQAEAMRACASCSGGDVQKNVKGTVNQ